MHSTCQRLALSDSSLRSRLAQGKCVCFWVQTVSPTEPPSVASLSELFERLRKEQQRQVQQINQNHQVTLRAVRDEFRRESKRLEIATESQVRVRFEVLKSLT